MRQPGYLSARNLMALAMIASCGVVVILDVPFGRASPTVPIITSVSIAAAGKAVAPGTRAPPGDAGPVAARQNQFRAQA